MFEQPTVKDKIYAILSYLSPIPFLIIPFFVIPLIMKRNNLWVLRHAKQGAVSFLLILTLGWIPLFGWIIDAVFIICWIIALASVLKGDYFRIPFAGAIADKLKI